jgi:3-vinyl bacteriochlorophyllide hydratase
MSQRHEFFRSAALLQQQSNTETTAYAPEVTEMGVVAARARASTASNIQHLKNVESRHGDNCNSIEPWPNPACKAWTPPAEYYNRPLYTAEQRIIRDKTVWTLVQGILAPLQFLIFAISLGLVARYLATGQGYEIATASIVAKTLVLYVIMITGSIWEKVVFGEWLFVESFFWEDVFSMLVLGLQTLYLGALIFGWWTPREQMWIALAAYVTYVINAAQFIWKLRMARLESGKSSKLVLVAS